MRNGSGRSAQLEGFWREGLTRADPPQPVALGEIGLDRFHLPKEAAEAERIFGGSARRLPPG